MDLVQLHSEPDRDPGWQCGRPGLTDYAGSTTWLSKRTRLTSAETATRSNTPLWQATSFREFATTLLKRRRFGASTPEDIIMPQWLGKTTKDPQTMDACRPDEWLIIRAWDES